MRYMQIPANLTESEWFNLAVNAAGHAGLDPNDNKDEWLRLYAEGFTVNEAIEYQSNNRPDPRGLARLDHSALLELRTIILTVIDDGDPLRAKFAKSLRGWHFDHDPCDGVTGFTEADANEQRLRFCDRIAEVIIARTAPAAVNERTK